jgi:hypothetical protein
MADEQMSLEGVLSDEKPVAREAPVEQEVTTEVKDPVEKQQAERNDRPVSRKVAMRDKEQLAQGRVRDPETGQYVSIQKKEEAPKTEEKAQIEAKTEVKEPVKAAAPQQEFSEKEKAFLRAAQEERSKRQELEKRLAAIEATKSQEPQKQFWDDPEGAIKAQQEQLQKIALDTRIQTAEMISRQAHPDFDEKIEVFRQIVQTAPHIAHQVMQQPNPAEAAYQIAMNHIRIQEAGSIEQLTEKVKKETEVRVRAEIEAELKAKAEALEKDRAALPRSLSDARSTGSGHRPVWNGPTPLDAILGKV